MAGLLQKIGVGVAASFCVGAIACQRATNPTEQPTVGPDEATEQPDATNPAAVQPQATDPTETVPADAAPAQVQAAPEAKPVPPLPAECTSPQTQTAMNTCAQAEYDQADVRLNNAYQSLKASVGPQKTDQLVAAEQAWLTFRDAYCNFVQSAYAGGSIQPTVYYSCLAQLTRDRTAELEQAKGGSVSFEAADQALNRVYQDLQEYLTPAEQALLTDAQLAWIDYRDAHCAFETIDTNACLAQVTETRTEQLQQQLNSRSR